MRNTWRLPTWLPAAVLGMILVGPGCENSPDASLPSSGKKTALPSVRHSARPNGAEASGPSGAPKPPASTVAQPAAAPQDDAEAGWTRKKLGDNVWFETRDQRRRVLVDAKVCLREGEYGLECLVCRRNSKEHESILATTARAKLIHAGLLLAGAVPGAPVAFEPKFKLPSGSPIKILFRYEDQGKSVTVPAQQWVWDVKTKKDLDQDWVFAGSYLYPNPEGDDKPNVYAADDDGSYICISNVANAMLDLPINSPRGLEERTFGIHTDRVPPIGTNVTIILEPAPEKKK